MKKLLLIVPLLCSLCAYSYGQGGKRGFTGTHKKHQWVDLGLSVKWATCNLGASTPEEYGNYYAWGEISPKLEYTTDNCIAWEKSWSDIGGDPSRDAARANWGGSWRMPTEAEFLELYEKCTWTRTTQNGNEGYKVTSKKNSQSIFLPAAGSRCGDELLCDGEYVYYWSSTPHKFSIDDAYYLYFRTDYHGVFSSSRYFGLPARPVLED